MLESIEIDDTIDIKSILNDLTLVNKEYFKIITSHGY